MIRQSVDMEEPAFKQCKLCLFKSEDSEIDEFSAENRDLLKLIVRDIFKDRLVLGDDELELVCDTCFEKLEDFYDFYQFVLENQVKTLKSSNDRDREFQEEVVIFDSFMTSTEPELPELELPVLESLEFDYVSDAEIKSKSEEFNERGGCVPLTLNDDTNDSKPESEAWLLSESPALSPLENKPLSTEPAVDLNNNTEFTPFEMRKKEREDLINRTLTLTCEHCPTLNPFPTYTEFQRHSHTVHKRIGSITCCNRRFDKRCTLANHLLKHNEDGEIPPTRARPSLEEHNQRKLEREELISNHLILTCDKCPQLGRFPNYQTLWIHTKARHNTVLKLRCCGQTWKGRHALAKHVQKWHVDTGTGPKLPSSLVPRCDKCGEEFPNNRRLQNHMKLAHAYCKYCKEELRQKKLKPIDIWSHEQQHLLSYDPSMPTPFICDLCNKSFDNRVSLKGHMYFFHIVMKKEEKYICHECGERFRLKGKYNEHVRKKHSNGGLRAPCPICGVMIRNYNLALRAHLNNVHNRTPTVCPACDVVYPSKIAMQAHFSRCHQEKKYVCSYCPKRFGIKLSLIDHEAVHLGISRYQCKFCPAMYKSRGNLAKHMRKFHPKEYEKQKMIQHLKRFES